jgi:GT2 family glycosyltransferase
VFNSCTFVRRCLESILRHPPTVPHEIIAVDNGSRDGSPAYLGSLRGRVVEVRNDDNEGFARACNRAAGLAHGEYLVFVNSDTIALEGWLEALLETFEAYPSVGAAAPKLLYPDGSIQHAGLGLSRPNETNCLHPYALYERTDPQSRGACTPRPVPAVSGAVLMVRRSLFFDLDGFDETFVNGYEDVDFCLRVRARGFQVRYCPSSLLFHFATTSENRPLNDRQNFLRFQTKWNGRLDPSGEDVAPRLPPAREFHAMGQSPWTWVQLVDVLCELGQTGATRRCLTQAVADDSQQPLYHGMLGDLLASAGEFALALESYQNGLSLAPYDAHLLMNTSSALLRMGLRSQAAQCLLAALSLRPGYKAAAGELRRLGYDIRPDQRAENVAASGVVVPCACPSEGE